MIIIMELKRIAGLFLLFVMTSLAKDQMHPCDRKCVKGARPKTCYYNWTLEHFVSMSVDCGKCPYKINECNDKDCVPANGVRRMITVINRQMPGPSIDVCKGDKVIVNLLNHAGAESTSIHWHGLNQEGTPYMDGVPMVTQCPILPSTSFRYTFQAKDIGTYFYHSHLGFQRTDGVNGMLVVRQPKNDDPNKSHYDYDLSDHEIMITDWMNKSGEVMFREFYHSSESYTTYLTTILVNGRGRLRAFRNSSKGKIHYIPYASFVVKKGYRYRFRVCSNANWICPIEVSVVKHDLLVVAVDGDSVKPISVNALVINPGERFDFVINANNPRSTYWMLFKGLLGCALMKTIGRAILKYENARDVEPPEPNLSIQRKLVLNPVNSPFTRSGDISLLKLRSFTSPDSSILKKKADKKYFIPFNLYKNLNPEFSSINALLPMVNATAFLAPPSPLLSQFSEIPKELFCSYIKQKKNCATKFCQCINVLKVKLGWVVEIFLIDEGRTAQLGVNHPWHMHGHHFRVIGGSLMQKNNTVAFIKSLDAVGKINRNLNNPVKKDTVSVPHGGYTILRFHATNPGFWALHCHVEMHTETGMMLIFQVGNINQNPPSGFPICGNFPRTPYFG